MSIVLKVWLVLFINAFISCMNQKEWLLPSRSTIFPTLGTGCGFASWVNVFWFCFLTGVQLLYNLYLVAATA